MNIGYVKLDKLNKFEEIYRNIFKIIKKKENCYYIPSTNNKILDKLRVKLIKDNVEYIIKEEDINLEYKELDGKNLIKYMIPEITNYCFEKLNKNIKLEEIHICANEFTRDNINIIQEMCTRVKNVNVVTNSINQYKEFEKRLERNDIYITVSNNKRKTLKRANLIINLDFEDFKEYSVNTDSIIINVKENVLIGKDFEGICIEKIKVNTNKVMRIFSEMENMDKSKLIESQLIKIQDYIETRKAVSTNKIKITNVLGRRNVISINEFENIKRKNIAYK